MNVKLTFVRPTTNNDGSPLAPADISHYTVDGTVTPPGGSSVPAQVSPVAIDGAAQSATLAINNALAGDTVCLSLIALTVDSRQSDPSAPGCVALFNRPNPPTGLNLTNA